MRCVWPIAGVAALALGLGCQSTAATAGGDGRPAGSEPAEVPDRAADEAALVDTLREMFALAREFQGVGEDRRAKLRQRALEAQERLLAISERLLELSRDDPEFQARQGTLMLELAEAHAPDVYAEMQRPRLNAQVHAARFQLMQLRDALELFRLHQGRYPSTSEGLRILVEGGDHIAPYVDAPMVLDPWGKAFGYAVTDRGYRLWTDGPDGRPGSPDDIAVRSPLEAGSDDD